MTVAISGQLMRRAECRVTYASPEEFDAILILLVNAGSGGLPIEVRVKMGEGNEGKFRGDKAAGNCHPGDHVEAAGAVSAVRTDHDVMAALLTRVTSLSINGTPVKLAS